MPDYAHSRCFNHAGREAVANCPECHRFFCRECVTEHADRVICAVCLKKLARAPSVRKRALAGLLHWAQCLTAILVAWFFFFLIGRTLARLPDSFHNAALWKVPWIQQR